MLQNVLFDTCFFLFFRSAVRAQTGSWSWKPYTYESKQVCDSELRFIRPGYARDSTGKWQVVVQTEDLPQRVAIDLCHSPGTPCKYFKGTFVSCHSILPFCHNSAILSCHSTMIVPFWHAIHSAILACYSAILACHSILPFYVGIVSWMFINAPVLKLSICWEHNGHQMKATFMRKRKCLHNGYWIPNWFFTNEDLKQVHLNTPNKFFQNWKKYFWENFCNSKNNNAVKLCFQYDKVLVLR